MYTLNVDKYIPTFTGGIQTAQTASRPVCARPLESVSTLSYQIKSNCIVKKKEK